MTEREREREREVFFFGFVLAFYARARFTTRERKERQRGKKLIAFFPSISPFASSISGEEIDFCVTKFKISLENLKKLNLILINYLNVFTTLGPFKNSIFLA